MRLFKDKYLEWGRREGKAGGWGCPPGSELHG